MNHFVALIDAIAWPSTVVIIALLFRPQLKSLLSTVQKAGYGRFNLEFSEAIHEIADDVRPEGDLGYSKRPSFEDSEFSPYQAVLKAWDDLELAARNRVECLLPKNETYSEPLERPLDYLEFKGALTPKTAVAIRNLRSLRDHVLASGHEFADRRGAVRYVFLSARVVKIIDSIAELPKVKLRAITLLVFEINRLVDSRKFDAVAIDEVYDWIKNKTVLKSLDEKARSVGERFDLSLFGESGPYCNFSEFYHDQLKAIYDGYGGDHRRRWGVENLGLCLLLAWTNQLIQYGSGWHPDEL